MVNVSELPKHHLEPLITPAQIEARKDELAREIFHDYEGQEVVFVAALLGGIKTTLDIFGRLSSLGMGQNLFFDTVGIGSYGPGMESNGQPMITHGMKRPETAKNRHVLLGEDIVDRGHTMKTVDQYFGPLGVQSLSKLALLDKPSRRQVEVGQIRYLGFTIPDTFVVGELIDWDEHYRGLPGIWRVILD